MTDVVVSDVYGTLMPNPLDNPKFIDILFPKTVIIDTCWKLT